MKNYLILFISGGLTSFIFPPFFIIPIGFITIPYFFYRITKLNRSQPIKNLFLEGFIYGLGLNFFLFFWLKNPFLIEEDTKKLFFLPYILVFYISLYYGFFTVILSYFNNIKIKILIFPALFVFLEIIRSQLFLSFPWNLFGYTFSNISFLTIIIKYIGMYGLSYIVITIFLLPVTILYFYYYKQKFYLIYFILTTILLLTIFVSINVYENKYNLVEKINLDVIIYQNNTPQIEKWNIDKMKVRFDNIIDFIEKNSNNHRLTLLIFSETEIPYVISQNDNLLKFIQSKIDYNTVILIGAVRKHENIYYNTFYRIAKNNINYFDKKILVPFGEYVPLANIFPFMEKFTSGGDNFSQGKSIRSLKLYKNINFIPTICYENIFLNSIINNKNKNDKIIINITNDAWFGKYQGPYQHFYHSVLRSIEYNKHLIRVSNNGISAIVNTSGKILASIPLNKRSQLKYNLIIKSENNEPFKNRYTFFYFYLFAMLLVLILVEFFILNDK